MSDSRALRVLPTPPFDGGRRVAIVVATLLALTGAATANDIAAPAKAPAAAETGRMSVTAVVAGIVSYTRWPAQPVSIRFCTAGQGRGVDELLGAAELGSTQRSVPVRTAASVADVWKDCDVVYFGALAGSAMRNAVQRAVGLPVLMIGEGPEFCSDGGMFCLDSGSAAVRFTVNLDAIARSGLRVNPSVLLIARNAPASGR